MNAMKKKPYQKIGQYDKRRAFSRKDAVEFRVGKKEFIVCPDCKNVHYKKSWHHDFPKDILPERRDIRFALCPACKMEKENLFEGEIVIKNVPSVVRKDVIGAIKNSDKQARINDPQDRVLRINEEKDRIVVQTSENQLAVRIAKKVKETFKGRAKLQIFYSRNDVTRALLTFTK